MYLGIDLGTSGVKVIILDDADNIKAQASESIEVSRPQPLWSEQAPEDWWLAIDKAIKSLKINNADLLNQVSAVGIAGQMHGATLLDENNDVLRPAILWNDGRCQAQCETLEQRVPNSRDITGNIAMPGFTAPKLLWVAEHEPEVFAQVKRFCCRKIIYDY